MGPLISLSPSIIIKAFDILEPPPKKKKKKIQRSDVASQDQLLTGPAQKILLMEFY